jgi:hypothetical protein
MKKVGPTIFPWKLPPDRPDPMEEQSPQDDDPNSSALNPMSLPRSLPKDFRAKGSLVQNWGWAGNNLGLTFFPG